MIGVRGFLLDLGLPLTFLLMVLAVVAFILHSKRHGAATQKVSTTTSKVKGVIFLVVVVLGIITAGLRFFRQVHSHSQLRNLAADSVASIQVGSFTLEKRADVDAVLSALRNSQWYSHTAGDGGWADPVDLTIRFKRGEELRYRVGRLFKREGAMIDFVSQNPGSNFVGHYGYAFVPELPRVLDRIGAPLPSTRSDGS